VAAPVTPRGITAQRGRTVHESGAYSRTMAQMVDRWVARALRNRRLVRSPIWLYRHGLGWLLGPRVLMLEHVGRKPGEPRYGCLEVVQREGVDTFVLVSGFGERAQWYRNLVAHPDCFVTLGRDGRRAARATPLSQADSQAVLSRYQAEHPRAWDRLRGAIKEATGTAPDVLPMVRLQRE